MKSKRRKTVSMRPACYLLFALCLCASILSGTASASTPTHSEPLSTTQEPAQYLQVPCAKEDAQYVGKHIETDEVFYYNVETTDTTSYANTNGAIEKTAPAYFPPELVQEQMNGITPHTIIGDDDRIKITVSNILPYSAIAYLEATWPDGAVSHGTAWMFYGDVAITSGHCVYSSEHGGWAKKVNIWVGTNGKKDNARAKGTHQTLYTSTLWIESAQPKDDWGIIKLTEDIAGSTGYLGITCKTGTIKNQSVETSGYPWKLLSFSNYWQYRSTGTIITSNDADFWFTADGTDGQSGSPIYEPGTAIAMGIYSGGIEGYANAAARITPSLFDNFMSFRK